MAGTAQNSNPARHVISTYNAAAVTAALTLKKEVILFPCRIGAVKAYAGTAATGAGNTVLDIKKNGTSVYTTTANRPTLATASTGEFANTQPDVRALQPGDTLELLALTIPATTGHSDLSFCVALNMA